MATTPTCSSDAEELFALLRSEGKEPVLYVLGRKALAYYNFRGRDVARSWTGFSQQPSYPTPSRSRTPGTTFIAGTDVDEVDYPGEGSIGVDELHIVYTRSSRC